MALQELPDEIIIKILKLLPPTDVLSGISSSSRRLQQLSSDALVWRHHCMTSFNHFSYTHEIDVKLRLPAQNCDWKALFVQRLESNALVLDHIDRLCRGKHGVMPETYAELQAFHYDIYDVLADQLRADPTIGDGLSRRYWSTKFLGSLHRRKALMTWLDLRRRIVADQQYDLAYGREALALLEQCFAAIDMFISPDPSREMGEITKALDQIAMDFRNETPSFDHMTSRDKARCLNQWLRASGFRGIRRPLSSYRNLRNCLLGEALASGDHETLPLLSSLIFCFMARRLGIRAYCTNFPAHVIVVVKLDGLEEEIYLDPFDHDHDISRHTLEDRFQTTTGIPFNEECLLPAGLSQIIIRLRNNIMSTMIECSQRQNDIPTISHLENGHPIENLSRASYAALWLDMMFNVPFGDTRDVVWKLVRYVRSLCPEDTLLVASTLELMATQEDNRAVATPLNKALKHYAQTFRQGPLGYALHSPVNPGSHTSPAAISIGNVVRHLKYDSMGVVTSLHVREAADGTNVIYYDVRPQALFQEPQGLANWVVEKDSIEVIHDERLDPEMFPHMGRTFMRYDRSKSRYVPRVEGSQDSSDS